MAIPAHQSWRESPLSNEAPNDVRTVIFWVLGCHLREPECCCSSSTWKMLQQHLLCPESCSRARCCASRGPRATSPCRCVPLPAVMMPMRLSFTLNTFTERLTSPPCEALKDRSQEPGSSDSLSVGYGVADEGLNWIHTGSVRSSGSSNTSFPGGRDYRRAPAIMHVIDVYCHLHHRIIVFKQ